MAATLFPPAPSTAPAPHSRARRALALALVFDALALAGTTLAREAPARPSAHRRGRFTRTR